jgi:hypothetical protein
MSRSGPFRTFRRFALAVLLAGAIPVPAWSQSAVSIGAPLTGEVVLNRDVEVRSQPSEAGRILSTLTHGKAVDALGTPRGSTWTQIGIGGVPLGYVPADALDPVYVVTPPPRAGSNGGSAGQPTGKPAAIAAAIVAKAAFDAAGGNGTQGYVVATRNFAATEALDGGKQRSVAIRKGQVLGLTGTRNGTLALTMSGHSALEAKADGVIGVATVYPEPRPSAGSLYVGRLGEFLSYDEGIAAWRRFVAGPGAAYADRTPIVWPVFQGGRMVFEAGVGPLPNAELSGVCAPLSRQGYDCKPIALKGY